MKDALPKLLLIVGPVWKSIRTPEVLMTLKGAWKGFNPSFNPNCFITFYWSLSRFRVFTTLTTAELQWFVLLQVSHSSSASEMWHPPPNMTLLYKFGPVNYLRGSVCRRAGGIIFRHTVVETNVSQSSETGAVTGIQMESSRRCCA